MITTNKDTEQRITILLQLLGPNVSNSVLAQLPENRRNSLRERLNTLEKSPPPKRVVLDVLREFDRLLKFASVSPVEGDQPDKAATPAHLRVRHSSAALPDDPFDAINSVAERRLIAALRTEAPRTTAVVLSCLDEAKAARVLDQLPIELRDATVLQLKDRLTPPLALLTRLLGATLVKCESFVEQELAAEQVSSEDRFAKLLRTMESSRRGEVLQMLEETEPDACQRIRDRLFGFEDLMRVEDRTLQKILGEIDTRVLSLALSTAPDELQQRVLASLSKRARESLLEEISLLGSVKKTETEEAQKTIVSSMVELDRVGELTMMTA